MPLLLLLAAGLRLYGLDWDGLAGAHPDERALAGVAEALAWPGRLNPLDAAPGLAYGHLPVYLLALLLVPFGSVDPLLPGRALAALADLGTLLLVFALGRRVYGRRVGLLAAALAASMVLHVQQAHYFTADVFLATFAAAALLSGVRLARQGRARDAWLAGACLGLAAGCKATGALLALPLAAACALLPGGLARRLRRGAQAGGAALLAFALTTPFALVELPLFWRNVAREAAVAGGLLDVPYTRQFHGTWAYVYPAVQQLRWGMGLGPGLAAFGGLAWAVVRAVRRPPRREEWVLLAWALPGFAFVGALWSKFPRTLLPLAGVLALYGARLLLDLGRWPAARRARWVGALLAGLVLGEGLLRALALVASYHAPHPWQAVTAWFAAHAPPGAVVAVEAWDHPLPLPAAGAYDLRELPLFEEESPAWWDEMAAVLAEADYVVVASRRGYGALARWPERTPLTARYYERLFGGELGFEPAACFGRAPRLGPLALADDPAAGLGFSLPAACRPAAPLVVDPGRLDESFVVYDRPVVVVFRRS